MINIIEKLNVLCVVRKNMLCDKGELFQESCGNLTFYKIYGVRVFPS